MTKRMLRALLPILLAGPLAAAAETPEVTDQSYETAAGERVIRQSIALDAPVARVWSLYTTAPGLESWAAPSAEIDLRIGGSIRSSFKVGAKLGEPGTVTSEIVQLIPEREITLRDDLVELLTMGGLFEWLDMFSADFLAELESEGDDVFTTVRFEPAAENRTLLTLFSYGYRSGAAWDKVYAETKKSNHWFLGNLAKRLRDGPIDWTARQ